MMPIIIVIALNSLREYLRDKILYNLLVFAGFLIGASALLGSLSIGEQHRIITDMGLAAINLIGLIMAVFLGIGLVTKEIERRTIYTVLAKPVERAHFIVGKYLGLVLTLFINVTVLCVVYLLSLLLAHAPISWALVQAVLLIFVELLLVTAVALFLSTFSSSTLSATMALGVYVIGHLAGDLLGIASKSESIMTKSVMTAIYYLFPNLELLNIKGQAANGVALAWIPLVSAASYGLLYAGVLLFGACAVFQRREF